MKNKKLIIITLVVTLVVTSLIISTDAFASVFRYSGTDDSKKLSTASFGIKTPNVNLAEVRDDRALEDYEIAEAVNLGISKEKAKQMTRYELISLIDSQNLSEESIDLVSKTNPELSKEDLSEWTYYQYNQYEYEKNIKQFMPSDEIMAAIKNRNMTVDDFKYLRKFYGSDDEIIEQSDEELSKILVEWYKIKLYYAKAVSNDPFYSKLDNSTGNPAKYNPSLYTTVASFQNYSYTNDLFLTSVKTHLSNYRIYQESAALKAFNAIYARPSSNTSATFTNLYGTYSQSQGGAHEGIDMVYSSTPDVHTITGGAASIVSTYNGAVRVTHTNYGSAIYAHMTNCQTGTKNAGEKIGNQGNVGNATGNHVHFEIATSMNSEDNDSLGSSSPYLFVHNAIGHSYPSKWTNYSSSYHRRKCLSPDCSHYAYQPHVPNTAGTKCTVCGRAL